MSYRHRIFLSFHHANDEKYKIMFERLFCKAEKAVYSHSVNDGDIDSGLPAERIRQTIRDNYLRNSSVTVVLIGTDTWRRKHVDWEISSSLRHTDLNRRSGLVGLILPSRLDYYPGFQQNLRTMPARLVDNVQRGYASLHPWTEDVNQMVNVIHNAWTRRFGLVTPDHTRPLMSYNARATDANWI